MLETKLSNMLFSPHYGGKNFIKMASSVSGYPTEKKPELPPQYKYSHFLFRQLSFVEAQILGKTKCMQTVYFIRSYFFPGLLRAWMYASFRTCFYGLSTRSLHKIHSDISQLCIIYSVYPCSTNKIFICII